MIDLTPLDVRKKRGDFRSRLRGYDPEEVDSFLELVSERLEALVKENMNLSEMGDRQATQLSALEEREKAVQDALVTAQRLRDDLKDQTRQEAEVVRNQAENEAAVLRSQAKREAELLKKEAEAEIERRLGGLDSLIRERKEALAELERKRTKFLKAFRNLLERELDGVEVEEARTPLEEIPLDLDLGGEDEPETDGESWEDEPEPEAAAESWEEEPEPPVDAEETAAVGETAEVEAPALAEEAEETTVEEEIEEPLSFDEAEEPEAAEDPEAAGEPEMAEDPAAAGELEVAEDPEAAGEPEVISLAEDVSEALGATALGGMVDSEPTPVEDLAPDDGAFSTQKLEPAFGASLGEEVSGLPEEGFTHPLSAFEDPVAEDDGPPEGEAPLAVPVGEMLMDELRPRETGEAAQDAPETDLGEPPELPEAEEEPDSEFQTSAPEAEEPPPPPDSGPSQPVWLSAILKEEEEDGSEPDEEDRQV